MRDSEIWIWEQVGLLAMETSWLVNDGNILLFTGNKMLNGKKLLVTVATGYFLNNGSRLLLTMKYVSSDVWDTWARKLEHLNGAVVVLLFRRRRTHLTVRSAAHQMLCCVLHVARMSVPLL